MFPKPSGDPSERWDPRHENGGFGPKPGLSGGEEVGDERAQAGRDVSGVEFICGGENARSGVGAIDLGFACFGKEHPDDADPGAEPLLCLFAHIVQSVDRRDDFYDEVGSDVHVAKIMLGGALVEHERGVRAPNSAWIREDAEAEFRTESLWLPDSATSNRNAVAATVTRLDWLLTSRSLNSPSSSSKWLPSSMRRSSSGVQAWAGANVIAFFLGAIVPDVPRLGVSAIARPNRDVRIL